MIKRKQDLTQLKDYTDNIEKEVTLLLQNLQWNPKLSTEHRPMVACSHDSNHKVPLDNRENHEEQCYLTKLGYRKEDTFLPEPADPHANTLVKFAKHEIAEIINNAAIANPLFKRGCLGPEPLTVERLQRVYSADERRAIYDAVVSTASSCHDLADLDLTSSRNEASPGVQKSRLEILAELRNMRRRRAKYRVPANTRNYSHVLRDVIKTQMDSYGEATRTIIKTEYGPNIYVSQKVSNTNSERVPPDDVVIKLERESPEHSHKGEKPRNRYRARSREKRYHDERREFYKDNITSNENTQRQHQTKRSREKRYDDDVEKRHPKNKYLSRESRKGYDNDHLGEYSRDNSENKSQEKRYYRHSYHRNYSSNETNKTFENSESNAQTEHTIVIKREKQSPEYRSNRDERRTYSSDRHREKSKIVDSRHHDSKEVYMKKHSQNERTDKNDDRRKDNRKRYSPVNDRKQDRVLADERYINGTISTKRRRERSISEERKRKARREINADKYSSRQEKECRIINKKRDFSPDIVIK